MAGRASFALFLASLVALGVLWGIVATKRGYFPYPQLRAAVSQVSALEEEAFERHETIALPDAPTYAVGPDAPPVADGLIFAVGMDDELVNFARVMDRDGKVIHEWRPDWFEIWPDDSYLPDNRKPQSPPGVLVHGAAVTPDGDLVVNFEHLSTVRLDPCGGVRWKLPNFAHHSVALTEDGNVWVAAEREVAGAPGVTEEIYPGIRDLTIQKISPEGEILFEASLVDILEQNDLLGLLHMSATENRTTPVSGDILHVNDVEEFPASMPAGFFRPGDILVSLRNINTILVIDPSDLSVKFASTGHVLRQHDADFVSGDRITVFDNRNTDGSALIKGQNRSRMLEIEAPSGMVHEILPESPDYFTNIMGKQQRLPNGNTLVTVTWQGQALELGPDGRLAWQLTNSVSDGMRGVLTEVDLLPPEMDAAFFERLASVCPAVSG